MSITPSEELLNVWYVLSELYLDQAQDATDFEFIGRRLALSSLSITALEKVLFDQVHPVCCWNLVSVAGVWSGFDRQNLAELITAEIESTSQSRCREYWQRFKRVPVRYIKRWVADDWRQVKVFLVHHRARKHDWTSEP